jgi:hypothetical protein
MKKILFFICVLAVGMLYSCGSVYDNIQDYATDETVYVGKVDELTGLQGFERVEIDLLKAGRIPSDEVKLGKAKKTVVEYDDQVITYDEVRSWVNITGLTTPKLYRFRVYNIDEFGNKSVPEEIALIPFTTEDYNALIFPDPFMNISPTAAEVNWLNGLTSGFFEFVDMVYSYTDKNGSAIDTITADPESGIVRFAMLDMEPQVPVTVNLKCRIIPKISGENIIDTMLMEQTLIVTPVTVEEYLASRTDRAVSVFRTTPTDGRTLCGDITDRLVFSEIRYKTNSGGINTLRILASENKIDCPDIKAGELYETRSAFVPIASIDTFYRAWRPSASPLLELPAGTYRINPDKTFRASGSLDNLSPGVGDEFTKGNKMTIAIEGPNLYRISDLLGGYYEPGRGYGEDYICEGIFQYDGINFNLIDFKEDPWRRSDSAAYGTFTKIEGSWDGLNETLTIDVYWADYILHLVLVLE